MHFKGPAAYVKDLAHSRAFYEGLLGLTVARVMRRNNQDIAVAYTAGLSIWLASDAYNAIYGPVKSPPATLGAQNWENTFETPEFEKIYASLQAAGTTFAHPLRELPWGQRGFRAYDPDGHIVDISETHGATVRRMFASKMSKEEISKKISLTLPQIEAHLSGRD